MNKTKPTLSRKSKRLIFFICILALPLIQFAIFYLYVNFNSIILAFQNYAQKDGELGYNVTFAGFNEDFGGGFLKAHNCEDYLDTGSIENPCPYQHESPDICYQVMCSCPDCGLAIFGYDYVNDEAFWRACECEN